MSSIKEYFKQEGLKEGYEQGFKQGDEHGFKQGMELVALNMLKDGEPTEKVALYTGLSEEKIASIRKRLNGKL